MSSFHFKRHIDTPFLDALQRERDKGGWWSQVIEDDDLIVALRGSYLNVYHHGQSLFNVSLAGKDLKATTHPKYLVDPGLKKQVSFNGTEFALGDLTSRALLSWWTRDSLARMKRAAKLYSGPEKQGCHRAVVRSSRLVDVEIAFSRNADDLDEEERRVPRVDLLLLETMGDRFALQFWEAKAFGNPELGSMVSATNRSGESIQRPVIDQIASYRTVLADHTREVHESYAKVCENLVALYGGTDRYPSGSAVAQIAQDASLLPVVAQPSVGLFLFGFDNAQKTAGKDAFAHLEAEVQALGGQMRAKGAPKGAFKD